MNLFNANTPAYKSARTIVKSATTAYTQPPISCGLSGLLGQLFGSSTPAYKTADGTRGNTASSSGLFGSLLSSQAPVYKTATSDVASAEPIDDGAEATELLDGDDEHAMACAPSADEVVLL